MFQKIIYKCKPLIIPIFGLILGCSGEVRQPTLVEFPSPIPPTSSKVIEHPEADQIGAEVVSVEVSGEPGEYSFSVGISSPDLGCEQYADWWEVINEDGDLYYRRILLHSHVNEQPFKRSGGPVRIDTKQRVIVRAHMQPFGYGSTAYEGSVEEGFHKVEIDANFALDLAVTPPLPDGCAF